MKFVVLGPDGIPIREELFDSRDDAERGIEDFVARFQRQGYYAGVGFRLELHEIAGHCRIEAAEDPEES